MLRHVPFILKDQLFLKEEACFFIQPSQSQKFFHHVAYDVTWAEWRNLENVPMLYPSYWLGMILFFVLPFLITSRVEVVPHHSTEEAPLGNFSSKNFGIHCSLTQHQEADLKK